jgi:outer membrane protein TolC
VRSRVTLLIAAALAVTAGFAQAQQAPARALTLDEALAMARKTNRSLIVERTRLAQAQTNLEQAWAVLFPTIAAQGKYTRNNIQFRFPFQDRDVNGNPVGPPRALTIQPTNQLDGVVTATLPLVAPPAWTALEAVKANVAASEANFAVSEDALLVTVAQTFYTAAGLDEILVARRSSIAVARATLQNAQTRYEAGAVTKVDVDRAELALVRAQQAERETANARTQTYRTLATLIQTEAPFTVAVSNPPPTKPEPATLDLALKLRPEFRALQLTADSASYQARAQAWRWAPTLSAFGNARLFNYDNFAGQHHAWAVGAQLDWALFDGGARDAQRHLALAQAREAEARAALLRDTIRDDLANGQGQLDTKRHAQEAAERSVALARETLDLVRTQYEAGTVTQVDLLQAQDALVSAQESLAQAHLDVAVADLTLRRAAGTFPGR